MSTDTTDTNPVLSNPVLGNPNKGYHAAPNVTIKWNFCEPPASRRSGKLQLLTIGGISTNGNWYGKCGQYFVAWAELMKYDKDEFKRVVNEYNASKINPKHN